MSPRSVASRLEGGAQISGPDLFPSALATAICWVGMEAVFSITFSGTVISDDKKYGPIGVVFALRSWLIAIAVVIILGAVAGVVWREQDLSFSAAFTKLPRHRSAPDAETPRPFDESPRELDR